MKFSQWFYSRFRLRFSYRLDVEAKVATISMNKPHDILAGVEEEEIKTLSEHFAGQGYHVIIRNY